MEMRRLVAACNEVRWQNPALRADSLTIPHEDPTNQVLGFVRELADNVILTVVNLSDQSYLGHSYGCRRAVVRANGRKFSVLKMPPSGDGTVPAMRFMNLGWSLTGRYTSICQNGAS